VIRGMKLDIHGGGGAKDLMKVVLLVPTLFCFGGCGGLVRLPVKQVVVDPPPAFEATLSIVARALLEKPWI